ncbi:MAG TPA: hypothetical protein VGN93_04420 [Shinella sp.]|jgi:hypothetical protein|uniref:hypothetical protein n=1 Tax=Shinella sp. TaxID=1870904 RepID=UPI002E137500|nr:hypothetical protein [Shinella sp.]
MWRRDFDVTAERWAAFEDQFPAAIAGTREIIRQAWIAREEHDRQRAEDERLAAIECELRRQEKRIELDVGNAEIVLVERPGQFYLDPRIATTGKRTSGSRSRRRCTTCSSPRSVPERLSATMTSMMTTMRSSLVTLEAAGTDLHIAVGGRLFAVPVSDGYVQRRDVIDVGDDACLTVQDLADVYRGVERLGVCFDNAAYTGRF